MNAVLLVRQLREGHIDAAQRTLTQTPPGSQQQEVVPVLLDICALEEAERGRVARRRDAAARCALIAGAVGLVFVLIALAAAESALFAAAFFALILLAALGDPLRWFRRPQTTLQENAAISLLAHADGSDTRVTGALIDALDCESAEARALLRRAVTHLIWNIDGDEAVLWLDEERRRTLRGQVLAHFSPELRPRRGGGGGWPRLQPDAGQDFTDAETDFLVSTLRALATVRAPKAVRLMDRVASSRSGGPNSETVALAARECAGMAREAQVAWCADARLLGNLLELGKTNDAARLLRIFPGPRQVALLLDYVFRQRVRLFRLRSVLGRATCATGAALLSIGASMPHSRDAAVLALMAGAALAVGWAVVHQRIEDARPGDESAAALLARYNDARLAAKAIDMLNAGIDSETLRRALWKWLRDLTPGSGGALKERHRRYLRRLLATPALWTVGVRRHSNEPAIAALHALGVAGDLRAADAAATIARSDAPVALPLRDAAYTCWLRLNAAWERAEAHRPQRP